MGTKKSPQVRKKYVSFEEKQAEIIRQKNKAYRDARVQHQFDVLRRGDRQGIYSLYEIFSLVGKKPERTSDKVNLDGHLVEVNNLRLRIFNLKGTTCEECGLVGTFFVKEKFQGDSHYSLHCYGYTESGEERRITLDHDMPRHHGGGNQIWNLNPMCDVCNRRKGCTIPEKYLKEFESD